MTFKRYSKTLSLLVTAIVAILAVAVACSPARNEPPTTPEAPKATPTLSDIWAGLIQQAPYPYTTPLPPAQATALDGAYSKFDPKESTRPFCRRCMPYPAEGGIWMLQLDKGIFRIFSKRSLNGWNSLGSFTVSGEQITLFNDPHCIETVGIYTWQLEAGELILEVVEDECADGWRAITFTNYPWESCQPPSTEAAITQHWPAPDGCYPPEITTTE